MIIRDFDLATAETAPQLEAVRELFTEYARALDHQCCFAGFQQELDGLPGEYAPPAGRLLLATLESRPAGCAALRPFDEQSGELKRLYVRPEFRGHGLGRHLTVAIIQAAIEVGYRRLCLDTLPSMTAAIALYAALGFRRLEAAQDPPGDERILMALDLGGDGASPGSAA